MISRRRTLQSKTTHLCKPCGGPCWLAAPPPRTKETAALSARLLQEMRHWVSRVGRVKAAERDVLTLVRGEKVLGRWQPLTANVFLASLGRPDPHAAVCLTRDPVLTSASSIVIMRSTHSITARASTEDREQRLGSDPIRVLCGFV